MRPHNGGKCACVCLEQTTRLSQQQSAGEMCQIGETGDKGGVVKRKNSISFLGWRQELVYKSFSLHKCFPQRQISRCHQSSCLLQENKIPNSPTKCYCKTLISNAYRVLGHVWFLKRGVEQSKKPYVPKIISHSHTLVCVSILGVQFQSRYRFTF